MNGISNGDLKGKIIVAAFTALLSIAIAGATFNFRSTMENREAVNTAMLMINTNTRDINKLEASVLDLVNELKRTNAILIELRVLMERRVKESP